MRISDYIEDPRDAEEISNDLLDVSENPWKLRAVEDAPCHTVAIYQLTAKLRDMCDSVLKELDAQRARAYTSDDEFVMVAGSLSGLDGFQLTTALTNAIAELAVASHQYSYWTEEHKQPHPAPLNHLPTGSPGTGSQRDAASANEDRSQ